MFRLFADWYRLAEITPNGEMLAKRWQGIEAFIKSQPDENALLDLVRVFLFEKPMDEEFVGKFRQHFIDADSAFPTRDNDLEMSLLAASVLAECIEERKIDNLFVVAQSLCCYTLLGKRKVKALSELVEIANKVLIEESKTARESEECLKAKIPSKIDPASDDIKQNIASNQFNLAWPYIDSALNQLRTSFVAAINVLNKNINILGNNLNIQLEENNILWWLYGEYSRDLECKFLEVNKPGICLILAKELSDLTLDVPGPIAARAFLDKGLSVAGVDGKDNISIKDAVNSADRQWRESYIGDLGFEQVADFCPLHVSLKKSLETDGKDDWVPSCKKAIGFDPEEVMQGIDVSMQFYLESLLIESIAE